MTDGDMSGTLYSQPFISTVHMDLIYSLSIQAFITGSPNGSMRLQVCVDQNNLGDNSKWADMPGSTKLVAGASNQIFWNIADQGYMTFRVAYVPSSGSGLLSLIVEGKGT